MVNKVEAINGLKRAIQMWRAGVEDYSKWVSEWMNALAVILRYRRAYLMEIPSMEMWNNHKEEIANLQRALRSNGIHSKMDFGGRILFSVDQVEQDRLTDRLIGMYLDYPNFPDFGNVTLDRHSVEYSWGEFVLLAYFSPTGSRADGQERARQERNLDMLASTIRSLGPDVLGDLASIPLHVTEKIDYGTATMRRLIRNVRSNPRSIDSATFSKLRKGLANMAYNMALPDLESYIENHLTTEGVARHASILCILLVISESKVLLPDDTMAAMDAEIMSFILH